jgi:hypothetical protein
MLLHLLLLSGKYFVEIFENKTFEEVFDTQWKIKNLFEWKKTETWPNNEKTFSNKSSLDKIYFFCNPQKDNQWDRYPGKTVVIYTDYVSHRLMTDHKNAFWYAPSSTSSKSIIEHPHWTFELELEQKWQNYYNEFKDVSWPDCANFQSIGTLPWHIQKEILNNPYTYECQKLSAAEYQGDLVLDSLVPILNSSDVTIRLQDLINSNGVVLTELLDIPSMNQKQLEFLKTWKQLHPPELLDKIGIVL